MISKLPRPKRNPKVVPIDQPEPISPDRPRLIASDKVTKRVIIAIGGQRLAYDFTTRITRLPPATGDHPAPIVPLSLPAKKRTRGESK
jgi:hypothetical protein